VAQRWRVEAALRDVDVARAQFYPNLNLVAFVGLSSLGLDRC
jgi:outer membrane protein TolC